MGAAINDETSGIVKIGLNRAEIVLIASPTTKPNEIVTVAQTRLTSGLLYQVSSGIGGRQKLPNLNDGRPAVDGVVAVL